MKILYTHFTSTTCHTFSHTCATWQAPGGSECTAGEPDTVAGDVSPAGPGQGAGQLRGGNSTPQDRPTREGRLLGKTRYKEFWKLDSVSGNWRG